MRSCAERIAWWPPATRARRAGPLATESHEEPGGTVLEIRGATRRFAGLVALAPVDLRLDAGHGLCLVGPNGAGKSTLLRLAAGVLLPTLGEVAVLGRDPYAAPEVRARIGFLGHETFLEPAEESGRQVEFCHRFRGGGDPTPEALREALELGEVWEVPAAALSRGFSRRVELACVMAGGPALLLLDEPLGGLDQDRRRRLAGLVRELNPHAAVLVATHRPDDLQGLTPRRASMEAGHLAGPEHG